MADTACHCTGRSATRKCGKLSKRDAAILVLVCRVEYTQEVVVADIPTDANMTTENDSPLVARDSSAQIEIELLEQEPKGDVGRVVAIAPVPPEAAKKSLTALPVL